MDQTNNPGESDGNDPTLRTKAGILGLSTTYDNISDKPFAVESNQARSATSIMVKEGTNLQ